MRFVLKFNAYQWRLNDVNIIIFAMFMGLLNVIFLILTKLDFFGNVE